MRHRIVALLLATAVAAAGCGSSHPAAARPAAVISSAASYPDPACPVVLDLITGPAPATQDATDAQMNSLQGTTRHGSTLGGLTAGVMADLLRLGFDQGGLAANTSADLATLTAGEKQLRAYCDS